VNYLSDSECDAATYVDNNALQSNEKIVIVYTHTHRNILLHRNIFSYIFHVAIHSK